MSNTKGTSAIVPPSGGGAQSGMGEKFSPDLFTGTGNFSVPVAVPAGRNGFQPELTLGYSTGNGNGPFGMGWALGIPGVTRKTSRGIPVYKDSEDIFILSGAEDLVPVTSTSSVTETNLEGRITHKQTQYRPRTEGLFARIIHHTKTNGEDYWEVHSKDGLISIYDQTVANPENRNAIFAWHLGKTIDPFGNEIVYNYERELVRAVSAAEPHSFDQLYLSSIKYAQYYENEIKKHLCEVRFNYEDRPDAFSVYRQGFEMRTTKRCKSIETFTHATIERKVKTYHFNYLAELPLNGTSMLNSVSVEGHPSTDNGSAQPAESEWMPPLEFGYSTFTPSRRGLRKIEGNIPQISLSQPGYELVDVTGNGLPDLLQMDGTGSRYWTNKGDGKFSLPRTMKLAPSLHLGQPGVQLIDANGDARSDLLVNNGIQAGYFSGSFNGVWDEKNYRPYSTIPSFNFADPEVQFMDLNGDGITDVLRNGAKFECFFNDPEKGFGKVRVTEKTFADFSFADPRIRFADMTGDGLQDIVFLSSGKVQYWPNLGYGRFGKMVNMKNAPRFPEQYNPKQILLGDLDGDGQADIAFVDNESVTLYVNQSGNSFSEGVRVQGTPIIYNLDSLRITDILGTGQAGILWGQTQQMGTSGRMYLLDFTSGNKPYVLQEMNNNMGSITRVEYGSSVYHYLRDEKSPLTRWKTQLPFPVQVVNSVEVLDLLSGGKLATEYNYHNGYWDGAEREFRGFAQVDAVDTESFEKYNSPFPFGFAQGAGITYGAGTGVNSEVPQIEVSSEQYSPPVLTKSWFYPGPVGQDYARWEEVDFSDQYWQGDETILKRTQQTKTLLASLPRRARRDALRTFRGTLLRSEVYALDKSPLQTRPYTVTESLMGLRLEFPSTGSGTSEGSGSEQAYVFFPFSVAQRTTQYERGDDPMHSFSFSDGFDAYGNPLNSLSVGLPRGANPLSGGNGTYLGTYNKSEYIYKDIAGVQYMVDRVKKNTSFDATRVANSTSIFAYQNAIINSNTLPVIGCSLNFYDGAAFEGLPYGQIGKYGVGVRSETLLITDEIIADAYGANTPECFKTIPDWSNSNDYPAAFEGLLQNGDQRLGYKDRRSGFPNHVEGWYGEGGLMKYDFQDNLIEHPMGLALETKDVFDNRSTIEYDSYQLLPTNTKQWLNATDFLETKAEYDYRTFQANKVTDQNDNITVFDFSPLGLLQATAVIGKGTEGDYKSDSGGFYERYAPSVQMEYDFFAFKNDANPVWVKTIQREQHYQDEENSPTIVKVEYSDGFGRLLQTRMQAEDVIFGNQTFGTSGLPPSQNSGSAQSIGIERSETDPLNVVVSGWKIYNNKGKVVEQYEPFFDKGFDYTLPQLSTIGGTIAPQLGVKIKMFYDSIGRVVKTVNPDGSQQRVIFGVPNALNTPNSFIPTPWENYAYDANDLAPLTHPNNNVPQSNWYTPKSSLTDALGRTITTTEHNAHYNAATELYENVVMQYRYDIRGNLLEVRDPYSRKVFEHIYDYRAPEEDENGEKQPLPPLWTKHIDSGESTAVFDAIGKPIQSKDAKDAQSLTAYDTLQRPTHGWSKNNGSDTLRLTALASYGEQATTPKASNLNGQLWKQYDESGKIESVAFDFKGNLLSKKQQVISNAVLKTALDNYETYLVDWTGLPDILGTQEFETSSEFDALNRVTKITLPENINSVRKEITPTYNHAGALEKVSYDGSQYVENIAYNAKGQRLLIAFGNDIMTRYAYENRTFRLLRQRSEKYVKSQSGNTVTYIPQSGTNKQDDGFNYDLFGNILKILNRVNDCGITGSVLGSDALDRNFEYDPLYRIISGDGRESNTQNQNDYLYSDAPTSGSPNANNVRTYTRKYTFDKLGNIHQLKQLGTNGFTRNFTYNTGYNTLQKIETAAPLLLEDYTYDPCGNQLTAGTTRNYVWNAGNQLVTYYNQVGSADPTIFAQYDYSGMNRVSKLVKTGTSANPIYERTIYIDGIFEYHILENGVTYEKNYVHIMDNQSRIAMVRIGNVFPDDIADAVVYNLEDQIGSSTIRLNNNGGTIDKEEYYPFGDSSFRTFAKKRYRYVGKEKDLESGLYYYGARYYAAWTCRFISIDPLASDYVHLTPYNYGGNKPINSIDIDGLQGENEPVTSPDTLQNNSDEPENTNQNIEYDTDAADNILPTIANDLKPTVDDQLRGDWIHPLTGEQYIYSNDDKAWANRLPEIYIVVNKEEINNQSLGTDEYNSAEKRVEVAREYEGQFKYSLGREKGTTNCADFVAMIMVQTDYDIAKHFVNQNGHSNVKSILNAIKKLNGTIRKENPQVGDLALWYNADTGKGHVEFVSTANGRFFTTFGAGSGTVPREMGKSKNGFQWLSTDYVKIGSLGNGGVFLGFWTPHK